MQIEQLWPELEEAREKELASKGGGSSSEWILRMIRPDPACPLHVGLEIGSGKRGLLLRVARKALSGRQSTSVSRSLEMVSVSNGQQNNLFGVALKRSEDSDTFNVLAEDLVRRISAATNAEKRVLALLEGIKRWQKFLAAGSEGLTLEEQAGLWGELRFLQDYLLPTMSAAVAVKAWQGMDAAHQDFLLPGLAIEVKVTTGKKPHLLKIASERQMDKRGLEALYLHHDALAARDGAGLTLPELIAKLRFDISGDPVALTRFDDALLRAGYFEIHQQRYNARGYAIRESNDFVVGKKFPCITENDLPEGVGSVTYMLSVDACRSYAVDYKSIVLAIGSAVTLPKL